MCQKNLPKKLFRWLLVLGEEKDKIWRKGSMGARKREFRRSKPVVWIVRTTYSDNLFPPIGIIRMSEKHYLNE